MDYDGSMGFYSSVGLARTVFIISALFLVVFKQCEMFGRSLIPHLKQEKF
jgi:hypothetical protein